MFTFTWRDKSYVYLKTKNKQTIKKKSSRFSIMCDFGNPAKTAVRVHPNMHGSFSGSKDFAVSLISGFLRTVSVDSYLLSAYLLTH